jgi:hypothetical protein
MMTTVKTAIVWMAVSTVIIGVRPGGAAVEVKATAGCLNKSELTTRLGRVVSDHAGSREVDFLISIQEQKAGENTGVDLKGITGEGDVVLDRQFVLSSSDCQSATELLATVVERFIQELPLERWTLEPGPATLEQPKPSAVVEGRPIWVTGRLGVYSAFAPVGVAFEGGLIADIGGRTHALSLEMEVLGSYPSSMGHGKVYTVTVVGGGSMMAAGADFVVNDRQWLPWAELAALAGRWLGPVILTISASVSPFRHTAVVSDKALSRPLSNVRLGLGVEIPIWSPES